MAIGWPWLTNAYCIRLLDDVDDALREIDRIRYLYQPRRNTPMKYPKQSKAMVGVAVNVTTVHNGTASHAGGVIVRFDDEPPHELVIRIYENDTPSIYLRGDECTWEFAGAAELAQVLRIGGMSESVADQIATMHFMPRSGARNTSRDGRDITDFTEVFQSDAKGYAEQVKHANPAPPKVAPLPASPNTFRWEGQAYDGVDIVELLRVSCEKLIELTYDREGQTADLHASVAFARAAVEAVRRFKAGESGPFSYESCYIKRDPRIDPRPGDRLRMHGETVRVVERRASIIAGEDFVTVRSVDKPESGPAVSRLELFRSYFAEATLIPTT